MSSEDLQNFRIFDSAAVVGGYAARAGLFPSERVLFGEFLRAGTRVLDLGVGTGRTTPDLRALASRYVALDYSPQMIAALREAFPGVEAVVADASDLSSFEDGSFDAVVFSFNGIDYLHPEAKRQRCLDEMARVLATGGVAILSSHNARAVVRRPGPAGDGETPRARARRIGIAVYASVPLVVRTLPTGSFRRGHGFRLDAPRRLVTFTTVPAHMRRSAERAGLAHRRTVPAEHPRSGRSLSTPWYYYVFAKPAPPEPRTRP